MPDTPADFEMGTFIDQDGGVWPVTHYFDADGYECDADDAVTAVAGAGDKWFAFDVAAMERPSVQ